MYKLKQNRKKVKINIKGINMFKKISATITTILISFIPLFIMVPTVHAAALTWSGGGADDNFSTAANWVGGVVPTNGDVLTFPTSVDSNTTTNNERQLNNDLLTSVGGIQVTGSYISGDYDYYKISGNALNASGNILGNDALASYPRLSLGLALTITANITIQSVQSTGSIDIGANTVTLTDSTFTGAYSGTGGSLVIDGSPINGSGGGGGCAYVTGTSSPSFASPISVNQSGTLSITSNTQGLAYSATSLTLNNGGDLSFQLPYGQDLSFNKAVTFNGGNVTASQNLNDATVDCASPTFNKQLIIPGNVTLTADTTFGMYSADIKFTGTVTGKQFIKPYFASTGSVLFSDGSKLDPTPITTNYAANSPATVINVSNNETAIVTGTYGDAYIQKGGTLKGTGTVAVLSVFTGGILAPGQSPGCITSGNLTLAGIYNAEIGGTTACTEYDQTTVTGTVDVTGGTLNVSRFNNFKPAVGQKYTIISNDAADAVTGTFANLAEGATFSVDGYVMKISYVGGDGNDVELTVQSVPTVPNTGFNILTKNPITTLLVTTFLALGMLFLARKYNKTLAR